MTMRFAQTWTVLALAGIAALSSGGQWVDVPTFVNEVTADIQGYIASPPTWLKVVGAITAFVWLVAFAASTTTPAIDPRRVLGDSERHEVFSRAGYRCEHKSLLWMRCSGRATHADHIHPHSKGGATTLANSQALCVSHNLRKSNHVPGLLYVWRLERRRRRYFPANSPRLVRRRYGA